MVRTKDENKRYDKGKTKERQRFGKQLEKGLEKWTMEKKSQTKG